MKEDKKYSTIQIQSSIKEELISYCRKNGYKISGLIENLFLTHLSGSMQSKNSK